MKKKKTKEQLLKEIKIEKKKLEKLKEKKVLEKEYSDLKKELRELKKGNAESGKILDGIKKGLKAWMDKIEENELKEAIRKRRENV